MRLWDLVLKYEGERLFVYDDANGKPITTGSIVIGHPTIARGIALDTNGISADESVYLTTNKIKKVQQDAVDAFAFFKSLSVVRQDMLCLMIYQIGLSGVKSFKKALASMQNGDFEKASREMLDSQWAKQTPERANEMAQMMRTGRYI